MGSHTTGCHGDRRNHSPSVPLHFLMWGPKLISHPDPGPFWAALILPVCQRKGGVLLVRKQEGLEGRPVCLRGVQEGGTMPSQWLRAQPHSALLAGTCDWDYR